MNSNLHKILGGCGFGLFFFGLLATFWLFPMIINSQIHANIDLKEGTMGYDTWQKQPFPLKFKVYFFNVTNTAEVQQGAKPIVKEFGPYVYDEYRERIDVKYLEEKDSYRYILKKYYYFNKKESGHFNEDDTVTILNAALVGTAIQTQQVLPTAMSIVTEAVPFMYPGIKDIFMTGKVKDILFNGITIHCTAPEIDFICGAMKGSLPKTIQLAPNKKDFIFSMFKHLNGTDDGPWEMERGIKNSSRGEVNKWENQEILNIWEEDSTCNMINGSDSSVFEIPKKKRDQRIYSFSQDFCRSIYIEYENETEQFGMKAVRYSNTAGPLNYNSGEMKCFCPFVEDDEGDEHQICPMNGLADVTPCMKAPILFSFPHFYLGDPKLLEYVRGLKPEKEKHEIYVNLEPTTATPLTGVKRVQLNMKVSPIDEFPLLDNVTSGIFPLIWIEEGVTLPDEFVHILSSNFMKIKIVNSIKVLMIIFGLGLCAAGGVLTLKKERMFCFGNNDTVDITVMTTKKSSPRNNVEGVVNRAYDANQQVTNGNNTGVQNGPWNTQIWHSGKTNGD